MLSLQIRKRLKGFCLETSLQADDGILVLFGPSGSGKSVTLQCIAGLITPDECHIEINDKDGFDSGRGVNLPPQRRRVGYVPQDYGLFPHLTVEQNITYGLVGLGRKEAHEKLGRMLHLMRLKGLEKRLPHELSGGQRQRVSLARAVVTEPQILLLDEPFSALDSSIRSRLRRDLLEIHHSLGLTTVFVTHDLSEAYTLGDRVAVYNDGLMLQSGTREEVFQRPIGRAVARFTGTKNIFSGRITARGEDYLSIQTEGFRIIAPPYPFEIGDSVQLCIRPEHIMLLRKDIPERATVKENKLSGNIVGEINRGPTSTLFFLIDGAGVKSYREYDLEIELPSHAYESLGLSRDRQWTVSLKKQAIHVFP